MKANATFALFRMHFNWILCITTIYSETLFFFIECISFDQWITVQINVNA